MQFWRLCAAHISLENVTAPVVRLEAYRDKAACVAHMHGECGDCLKHDLHALSVCLRIVKSFRTCLER